MGLFDMMMIKDNHIAAAGGIEKAVRRADEYIEAQGLQVRTYVIPTLGIHVITSYFISDSISSILHLILIIPHILHPYVHERVYGDVKRVLNRVPDPLLFYARLSFYASQGMPVEVETRTLEEVKEILRIIK